jgi:hypothetical protein
VRPGIGIALLLALCLIAGCDGGSENPPPEGPLADALSEIAGSGSSSGALGVGWTDPPLARAAGVDTALMGDALGPNARSFLERAPRLRARFGFDPLIASRLISVGGSYAFGLRLDGVGATGLRTALASSGRRVGESEGVELIDVGGYAQVPEPLVVAGVYGLGARDAFGPELTVLSISANARASLLGHGDRLIDQPTYRAAAACLGDVVAARMIPDKLLISVELGVDLIAIGVARDRDVLCLLGGTAERARRIESSLRSGLAAGAREPRTGRPLSEVIRAAEVTSSSYEGVRVVRASVRPASGGSRGFLFDAIGRGSLPLLING